MFGFTFSREFTRPMTVAVGFLPSAAFILKKKKMKCYSSAKVGPALEETVPEA